MASNQKIPKWLLVLRFAPIIIQLVDDIFIEVKRKDPVQQDPLFATKMRMAQHSDLSSQIPDGDPGEIPPPL